MSTELLINSVDASGVTADYPTPQARRRGCRRDTADWKCVAWPVVQFRCISTRYWSRCIAWNSATNFLICNPRYNIHARMRYCWKDRGRLVALKWVHMFSEEVYVQGVPGGMGKTSGECFLCWTIPI